MYETIPQELLMWLKTQDTGKVMLLGTPIFKSAKACIIASSIGYNDQYRASLINDEISIYLNGRLSPLKIT
jgi:hypothetical protein